MQRNRDLADKVKQLQQKNTQLTRQMQIQVLTLSLSLDYVNPPGSIQFYARLGPTFTKVVPW